jgi:hypothetical protein
MELTAAAIVGAPWWFPTETVQLAFIAGGGGVLSAFIMSLVTAWNRSREKRQDWERQDAVALQVETVRLRAEEAARLLLAANIKVTDKVEIVRLRAEETARVLLAANTKVTEKVEAVRTRAEETASVLLAANAEVTDKVEAVRARAEETARVLVAANTEVTEKVEAVRARAEETATQLVTSGTEIAAKLEENHTLAVVTHAIVNNSMTATLQTLYDALRAQIVLMRELHSTNPESAEAIASLETRISELKSVLVDRRAQEDRIIPAAEISKMAESVTQDIHSVVNHKDNQSKS